MFVCLFAIVFVCLFVCLFICLLISMRCALLLTKKGKLAFEKTDGKHLITIQALFKKELSDSPAASGSSASSTSLSSAPLQDARNPLWLAKHAGYEVGAHFTLKNDGGIFQFTGLDASGSVLFEERGIFLQGPRSLPLSIRELNLMVPFKGHLPHRLPSDDIVKFLPHESAHIAKELARTHLFQTLLSAGSKASRDVEA